MICYLAGNLLNLAVVGQHLRHMQHEGRAGKWKRVKLFKEKLANASQKNIPEKPQIDNGQWTHLMSEIKVFNMFKSPKVVLLCSSAPRVSSG